MIESILAKGLDWILTQGVLGVVAMFLILVVITQDKRLVAAGTLADQQAEKANALLQEQFEKRLNEFREILDVMSNSTNTVTAMHNSLSASTEAINQLAAGFATLLHEFHAQQARWDDRRGAMAKQLDEMKVILDQLIRRAA